MEGGHIDQSAGDDWMGDDLNSTVREDIQVHVSKDYSTEVIEMSKKATQGFRTFRKIKGEI